ncbi:hypothetical protein EV361DRAFT_947998 [Lentinula raphanica]|uniref:Uncharacterized protein n=1 Tax=Lentinula raphanica TaxID=153919 RepID=A0AA38NZF2_9AGAR|nr:hypothetical protein F5878DRAFT_416937 [Lentinula raphanica]KAJ3973365.1 hypothetical protein EV361DRAFT_947998 [Lentinula raphanica]
MLQYSLSVDINRPTPKELSVITQTARENTWGIRYPPKRPPPPPGYIRVRFYSHIYKIRHEMLPDMEDDVQLTGGYLDLRNVSRLWNLEHCVPIDPERWIPVYPANEVWLSPLAMNVLSSGHTKPIMFIEPGPLSPETIQKRELRDAAFQLSTSLSLLIHIVLLFIHNWTRTPISFIGSCVATLRRCFGWLDENIATCNWIGNKLRMGTPVINKIEKCANYANDYGKEKAVAVVRSENGKWVMTNRYWIVLVFCLVLMILGWMTVFSSVWEVLAVALDFAKQVMRWAMYSIYRFVRRVVFRRI